MNFRKEKLNENGMTLAEVTIGLMVMVIFLATFSLSTKFFQSKLKPSNIFDKEQDSYINIEHKIMNAMDKWAEILSQSSFTREEIKSMGCSLNFEDNSIWDLPGSFKNNLPKDYKYCIFSTVLVESNFEDLISNKANAKPGIYLIYAIPDKISPTSKPLRKLMCRPITYC